MSINMLFIIKIIFIKIDKNNKHTMLSNLIQELAKYARKERSLNS